MKIVSNFRQLRLSRATQRETPGRLHIDGTPLCKQRLAISYRRAQQQKKTSP